MREGQRHGVVDGREVPVQQPPDGLVPVGRVVVVLGPPPGVEPQQVVERIPCAAPSFEQVTGHQAPEAQVRLPERRPDDRGRRVGGEVGTGYQARQPEEPARRAVEPVVGQVEGRGEAVLGVAVDPDRLQPVADHECVDLGRDGGVRVRHQVGRDDP